jgi:hypothetical protein
MTDEDQLIARALAWAVAALDQQRRLPDHLRRVEDEDELQKMRSLLVGKVGKATADTWVQDKSLRLLSAKNDRA